MFHVLCHNNARTFFHLHWTLWSLMWSNFIWQVQNTFWLKNTKKNVFKEKSWFLLVVFQNVCFFDLFQKWPWVLEEMTQQNNKTPSFGNTVILKSIYVHLLPKSNKLQRSLALYSNDHMKTLNKVQQFSFEQRKKAWEETTEDLGWDIEYAIWSKRNGRRCRNFSTS